MILYHGTDYESGMKILQKGFGRGAFETVWDCSNPSNVYLVSKDYDDDGGMTFAIEAAQIAAAMKDSKSTSLIVFEFEIDEDDIEDDSSCRDWDGETEMSDCYQIDSDYLNQLIEKNKVSMKVYEVKNAYIPYLRIFYIPFNNDFLEIVDNLLYQALETIHNSDCCGVYDYLFDYGEMEEINRPAKAA